jgi:hypothetical protein
LVESLSYLSVSVDDGNDEYDNVDLTVAIFLIVLMMGMMRVMIVVFESRDLSGSVDGPTTNGKLYLCKTKIAIMYRLDVLMQYLSFLPKLKGVMSG